jgi:3,5-epimerase/4-reductase
MKLSTVFFVLLSISYVCSINLLFAETFLLFGARGWIGGKITLLLAEQGHTVYAAQARLEDRQAIEHELNLYKPDRVINAAGVTGRPNIDWCEDHKQETLRANIIGALNLADICFIRDIHMTNFGTGCIYEYNSEHAIYSGKGFKETDEPNFAGSYYSKTKIMLDKLLQDYPNILNLRLRMPISDDLHERSFITKIIGYHKVVNIPNSMSILTDLLPVSIVMSLRKLAGAYNFVNPGVISHNEILDLYKKYIDPAFTYSNFTVQEQDTLLKARRSNNELDAHKLLQEFPHIPPIGQSIVAVFERMQKALQK